ncbi:hypothetical protein ACFLYG_00815 [Chloroflexota bacterium]
MRLETLKLIVGEQDKLRQVENSKWSPLTASGLEEDERARARGEMMMMLCIMRCPRGLN